MTKLKFEFFSRNPYMISIIKCLQYIGPWGWFILKRNMSDGQTKFETNKRKREEIKDITY